MIHVMQTGVAVEDIRRLCHSINYSEVIETFNAIGSAETVAAGVITLFGGVAENRAVFRTLLPDARWWVYAAGWVDPGDGNTASIGLGYEDDTGVVTPLGIVPITGGGRQKQAIGPFDVFATVGVPPGETIPMIRLFAGKDAGAAATLENWVLWVRYLAAKQ